MSANEDNPIRAEKRNKLKKLRDAGINPYPHAYKRTGMIGQINAEFAGLTEGEIREDQVFKIAGRLMTKRPMGKAAFFNLQDQSGNLQCYLKTAELSTNDLVAFDNIDIGDIVGIEGYVFKTRKGELSLHTKSFSVLCKSLEPLPEKYHGIQDIELKYRYRHLDLIMDIESRDVFITRSKIISEIRSYLNDLGFLEVETPMLQPIYGGAAAKPFTTHHNALDMTLYMRISPELYLKKLIVGGLEKVYEINKNFRNEGIDRTHNPEFTLLEYYEAYTDYFDQMKRFEDLIHHLAQKIVGSSEVQFGPHTINFKPPWRRLSIYDSIKEYGNIDPEKASAEQLFARAKELGTERKKPGSHGEMCMELFDLIVEPQLIQPTFMIDFPVEVSPLTKMHREKPGLVERFEPICAGMEIGNAYTELNDPEDQLARLKEQEAKRASDAEAHPMDSNFMHAIDVGMPPTGGVGVGIERIVMLLTNRSTIRDILLFPTMKPKE